MDLGKYRTTLLDMSCLGMSEKKYGKPTDHWMKELKKVSKLAHMEQVAHLKERFEMGHGHANALVAAFRKENGL